MPISTVQPANEIRAAAILTNADVASTSVSMPSTQSQDLLLYIDFTLGSLTNGIFTPQVSHDGTTWYDLTDPGALTLTATGTKAIPLRCQGAKLFRCLVKGTGTVTSSSARLRVGFKKT